jgi:uncharacterized membrane protein YjjB (DUF3815 family)
MNQIKNKVPLASCLLAAVSVAALALGQASIVVGVSAAALALALGTTGIIVSRGMPRHQLAFAVSGIAFSVPLLLFWGFFAVVFWNVAHGQPF